VTDAIDEFSYYVPPAQMAAYKSFSDVEDNGVGLIVTKRFGYAFVIAPVAGSPAAKSGIERGDFIEKIDGQPTQKMAVWQVRNLLRSGKPMHVQVLRGGQTKRDDSRSSRPRFTPSPSPRSSLAAWHTSAFRTSRKGPQRSWPPHSKTFARAALAS